MSSGLQNYYDNLEATARELAIDKVRSLNATQIYDMLFAIKNNILTFSSDSALTASQHKAVKNIKELLKDF